MPTIDQLRRLAADCRADHEKAPIFPDTLDALLDIAVRQDLDALLALDVREGESLPSR